MNRNFKICLLLSITFLLVSCGNAAVGTPQPQNSSPSPEITQQAAAGEQAQISGSGNYGVYDMTGELVDKLNKNPIDQDYLRESKELNQSPNYSTLAAVQLESKYTELWDKELNAVYNKLLPKLNQKEKDALIQSQKGWLQYHLNESELVKQVFYLGDSGQILGSQGKVQMQQAFKGRIRERTLELIEYYSLLGNEVNFEYKSKEKQKG